MELIVDNHESNQFNIYFTPLTGVSSVEHLNCAVSTLTPELPKGRAKAGGDGQFASMFKVWQNINGK